MTQDVLKGIGELIDRINNTKINNPEASKLLYEAADKLEVLFDYIVDTETKSAIRIGRLEEALEAKNEFISELQEREYRYHD